MKRETRGPGGKVGEGGENASRTAASSHDPDVAAQPGGQAHIVWQDVSPGQPGIFCARAEDSDDVRSGRIYRTLTVAEVPALELPPDWANWLQPAAMEELS